MTILYERLYLLFRFFCPQWKYQLHLLLMLACLFLINCQSKQDIDSGEKQNRVKPNIVLIVSDDHGMGDMGAYGNNVIKTPNLDAFAKESVRFTNARCTSASCSASRSVILTGIYNHANGVFGHTHDYNHFSAYKHIQSLPVLLSDLAGYSTARIGKYHLAPEKVFHFDQEIKADPRNAVEMADNSLPFLKESEGEPFFLYFCPSDPHRSGKSDNKLLTPDNFGNKEEAYPGVDKQIFQTSEVEVPSYLPDTKESREELAAYYQAVARMDQGIGKLFEHLKSEGLWDNTIIVYISDNGIAFEGAKTTLYEPGIKLPCLIKNIDQKNAGFVTDAAINWANLTPTLLDLVNILPQAQGKLDSIYQKEKQVWGNTSNPGFQAASIMEVLENKEHKGPDETFASHTFHEITMYYPMRAVISGNYKLIWNVAHQLPYPQADDLWESSTWQSILQTSQTKYGMRNQKNYINRPQFELYDLENDPNEIHNLVEDSNQAENLRLLKNKLQNFQKETNDPWLIKWQRE